MSRRRIGVVLLATAVAVFAGPGCAPKTGGGFSDPALAANAAAIKADLQAADLVFVGRVTAVGEAPPSWSGIVEMRQTVTYDVVRVLRGSYGSPSIAVRHVLVSGSRNADAQPGLLASRFAKGQALIVSVRKNGVDWDDIDENFGTIPDTPDNEAAVKGLL